MSARRGLRFTLCILLSAAAIIGMLPITQALATGFSGNEIDNDGFAPDGLISELLGDDDDDEEDDDEDDDNEGRDDDKEKDEDSKGKNHRDDSWWDRPEAHDQIVEVDEDSSIKIELEGESDNELTFEIVEEPEHGELLEFDPSGSVTYEPETHYYGSDNFTFKARDGNKESRQAIVTLRVSSVNDVPVALPVEVTTTEGNSISFVLGGSDIESEDLEYSIVSGPSHGKLSGAAPSLEYMPERDFSGTDELTFKVNDGSDDSETATVKIVVKAEKKKDKDDDSDRWWEDPPVTQQTPSEPQAQPTAANVTTTANSTEAAPKPIEPEQSAVVAPLTQPEIVQKPAVNTVLAPRQSAQVIPAALPAGDVVAPQIILPGSLLEIFATSTDGAMVAYAVKAVDDVDGEVQASCSPVSGSTLPLGKFDVVCRAEDAAGNIALNSFTVVVSEASEAPSAASPGSFLFPVLVTAVLGAGSYFGFKIVMRRLHRYPS